MDQRAWVQEKVCRGGKTSGGNWRLILTKGRGHTKMGVGPEKSHFGKRRIHTCVTVLT